MILHTLNILFISVIIYVFHRKYRSLDLIKYFFPALGIKLLAGAGIGWLYLYHYGHGDTIVYHEDAVRLSDLVFNHFSAYLKVLFGLSHDVDTSPFIFYEQPRAFFLVKILSAVHLLSGQNYWVSGIYFSLFSFTGFWMLANTLTKYFPENKLGIIVALLFFPSVIFWSSGIIKESIAMGAMMWLIKLLIDWLMARVLNWKKIGFCIFLLLLTWHLKYYYLGVFLLVTIPLILTDLLTKNGLLKINKYMLYAFLFVLQIGVVSLLHHNFHLANILQVIVDNHDLYRLKSQPGQFIYFDNLEATWLSIAYYFPFAVWSGLFRVGIWEANHVFEYLVGIENLTLLIFSLAAIFQLSKLKNSPYKLLLIAAIIYVVLLSGFLALSAPNFGTLERYRVGYLPIMILLITYNNPVLSFLKSKIDQRNQV